MGWGWGWGWVKPSGCLPIELVRQPIRIAYALASGGGGGWVYLHGMSDTIIHELFSLKSLIYL